MRSRRPEPPKRQRKIVQITATATPATNEEYSTAHIVALCDDGTVWRYNCNAGSLTHPWKLMPPIPVDSVPWEAKEKAAPEGARPVKGITS